MPKSDPRSLLSILNRSGDHSARLVARAKILGQLDDIVRGALPDPLRTHVRVANYKENVLILHADSASWATKMRFFLPALKDKLKDNQLLSQLREIHIKPRPNDAAVPSAPPRPRPSLSSETADLLENLSNGVTNSDLAEALRRLARRGKPPGK